MAGWSFDPFRGVSADLANPSVYDVQRRQDLAKTLLGNKLPYEAHQSPLSAIADALAGTSSAFESSQAAQEAQAGLGGANAALAQALSGGADPASLITAGGNPFLPASESGLVGDLIKRKMGIGETYYGTPIAATGPDGKLHYYRFGSLGDQQEVSPGEGQNWSPQQQFLDTGTGYQAVPKNAGINLPGVAGTDATGAPAAPSNFVPKNNAQAESDKAFGGEVGKIVASAPEQIQKEGQLLQTLDQQHQMVAGTVDKAISQIDSGVLPSTGTVGSLLSALPGTPQYDLAQNLQTIKANVGFDTLQNMRANSPTGGALGQISNMEEQLLQAVNGSLAQGQTGAQLKANLNQIKTLMVQVNALKHQAYQGDVQRLGQSQPAPPQIGGQQSPVPLAPQQPQQGNVVDYSTYFGGGQ